MRISDWSSECALPISGRHVPAHPEQPTALLGRSRLPAAPGRPRLRLDALSQDPDRGVRPVRAEARCSAQGEDGHGYPPGADQERFHREPTRRSEEHTSELQSLMRISYAVFCLKKKINTKRHTINHT